MKSKIILFIVSFLIISCTSQTQATIAPTDLATAEPVITSTPASVTTSENGHSLTLIWQSEFTPQAAIGAGVDIALDDEGNLYVTTANVKKYDSEGKFLLEWGPKGTGDGQFGLPTGIATGPDNFVYVNDFPNQRIQKFDSNGNYLFQWEPNPAGSPGSIAVDQDGYIYVSLFSAQDHNIQKFDSNGNLITDWGGTGAGDGEFAGRIEDITLDKDGNIYATDSYNHRIQKFDSDGNFLAKFGSGPSKDGNGTFTDPEGLAIDYDGNIYVVDNYFVQKLDKEGNFIAQWSKTQGGDLDRAGFLTVDKNGDIYILARTEINTPTGVFELVFIKKFRQS